MYYKLKNNQGTSGFTWSEEDGANIGFEDEAVWEAYIKVCYSGLLALLYLIHTLEEPKGCPVQE